MFKHFLNYHFIPKSFSKFSLIQTTISGIILMHEKVKMLFSRPPSLFHNFDDISLMHYELTHSYLETSMTNIVWTYDTFKNIFQINHKLETYLKESCRLVSDQHFSFKYFLKNTFVRKISQK